MTITNVKERSPFHMADLLDLRALSGKDINAARGFEAMFQGRENGYNAAGDLITATSDGAPLGRMWAEFQKTI